MSIETKDLVSAAKRRPLLSVCVVVAVTLLLILYFRKDSISEAKIALEERDKVMRGLALNIKNAENLDQQTVVLRRVNTMIANSSLVVGDLALNQQVFLVLETEVGIKLLDIRPSTVRPLAKNEAPDAYVPMPFTLTVSGSYPNIIAFIRRLERGPVLGRITSLAMSEAPQDTDYTINLSIELLARRG